MNHRKQYSFINSYFLLFGLRSETTSIINELPNFPRKLLFISCKDFWNIFLINIFVIQIGISDCFVWSHFSLWVSNLCVYQMRSKLYVNATQHSQKNMLIFSLFFEKCIICIRTFMYGHIENTIKLDSSRYVLWVITFNSYYHYLIFMLFLEWEGGRLFQIEFIQCGQWVQERI